MNETREKILDAAEFLFGQSGYAATSLRHIIAEAGVNLAAIHYHFGSKQDLLDQVILRKVGKVNESRLRMLEQFEAEAAPGTASVEKVLEAFIAPAILIEKSPEFIKLMGRVQTEGLMPDIARRHFQPLMDRFFSAMRRALPEMSQEELAWKSHFTLGAMAYTLTVRPAARTEETSIAEILKRLVSFLSGGFRAPAGVKKDIEVNR